MMLLLISRIVLLVIVIIAANLFMLSWDDKEWRVMFGVVIVIGSAAFSYSFFLR